MTAVHPSPTRYDDLPRRCLDEAELRSLVSAIAAAPHQWRDAVAFDDDARHYQCLHRDDHVDVWVLCWTPVNDTGWHDHDTSRGAVAVVQGALVEHGLALGAATSSRRVEAGRTFSFGPERIHRLCGLDAGSVSIHAYSPPLTRLGQYAVDADGVLSRTSISYTDELSAAERARPVTAPTSGWVPA